MKIPKIEVDAAQWDEAIKRLSLNEWSRKQCAEFLGLNYSTFVGKLRYAGIAETLAHTRRNAGATSRMAQEDPERHQRYQDAVRYALTCFSVTAAAKRFDVNYQVLSRKVRAAKAKLVEEGNDAGS